MRRTELVYGIPEQVAGTTFVTKFPNGYRRQTVLLREPKLDSMMDQRHGIQKLSAAVRSGHLKLDGDQQMLE